MTVSKTFLISFWLTFDNVESFSVLPFTKFPKARFHKFRMHGIFSPVFSFFFPLPCPPRIAGGGTKYAPRMRECREDEIVGSRNNMQMNGHSACSLSRLFSVSIGETWRHNSLRRGVCVPVPTYGQPVSGRGRYRSYNWITFAERKRTECVMSLTFVFSVQFMHALGRERARKRLDKRRSG